MKKEFITINDRIVCDKNIQTVTKEYMKKICPAVIDLIFKEITEYYLVEGLTREEYQAYIVKNISDAYMKEVYTEKNVPTYHENMKLVIDINDIYTYKNNHCQYYFVEYKNHIDYNINLNKYKQEIHEQLITNEKNMITIETKPMYNTANHNFQKVLCPIIEELLVTNKTRLNSNKLMNKILIVQNISKEFMHKVYTEENFGGFKMKNTRLKAPSLEDIYRYNQNHCQKQHYQHAFEITLCVFYVSYIVTLAIIVVYLNKPLIRLLFFDFCNQILKKFRFMMCKPQEGTTKSE